MVRAACCEKNIGLKKGPWTSEEDHKLIDYIQKNGYGNWRTLPKNAGLQRCGKSCRLRWTNYLRPDIKRGRFSFEEEETIIQLHGILGNKWSAIAAHLPGRTDNEIKNYWNTNIRKKLLRMGIDPVTHTPRLDLLDLSSNIHMNISRLFGFQPTLLNPELLRLSSTSILSSQSENSHLSPQNFQQNLISDAHQVLENQLPPLDQTRVPFVQLMQPNVEQFSSSDLADFNSQSCQINDWQSQGMTSGVTEQYGHVKNYGYYLSDESIMDPSPSENSNYQSNNGHDFTFQSVLSTPSSSTPTLLNSYSSTHINSTTTEEYERESYSSSNMMKYEIQDILDVNELMYSEKTKLTREVY